ncbi:MAG: trypsin-like peptidase domain-containing protein [Acidimicrobiia bacterium]
MDDTTPHQDPVSPDPDERAGEPAAAPREPDRPSAPPPAPEPPPWHDSLQPDFARQAFPPRDDTPPPPPPQPTWDPEPATATHGAAPLAGHESPATADPWAGSDPAFGVGDPVPTAPPPAPRRPRRWPLLLLALLSGIAGAAAVGALFATGVFDDTATPPATAVTTTTAIRTGATPVTPVTGVDASAVARKVVPSIVTVQVGFDGPTGFDLYGSGSGVVLTEDGYIVTNHHVLEDVDLAQVVFQDGRTYAATIVGSDARTDLAVLRIDAATLTPIEFGATDTMEIGEVAIAVGNPLGLPGGASLTMGVVSAFEREVITGSGLDANDRLFGMLQTDAPIQQGSSGGALVDGTGRLIGITTAIGVSSAGAEGIGFAIPVEVVHRVVNQLIATGTVHHAFLGVGLQNVFQQADDGAEVPAGALIQDYAEGGSAAEAAGLEIGDVIVASNGVAISNREQLISALHRLDVGDVVALDVNRDGELLSFDVVLGERPPDE